jgi:hypothetical protein
VASIKTLGPFPRQATIVNDCQHQGVCRIAEPERAPAEPLTETTEIELTSPPSCRLAVPQGRRCLSPLGRPRADDARLPMLHPVQIATGETNFMCPLAELVVPRLLLVVEQPPAPRGRPY